MPTTTNLMSSWLIQMPLTWALALQFGPPVSGMSWVAFGYETSARQFTLRLLTR